MTLLVALTGLPSLDLRQNCRGLLGAPTQIERWEGRGQADPSAGAWPDEIKVAIATAAAGVARAAWEGTPDRPRQETRQVGWQVGRQVVRQVGRQLIGEMLGMMCG